MTGTDTAQQAPRAALFADRNFRWLMSGSIISMLGDQFTQIALPWLVLKMSGDTLALGVVVALMGIPRAVLILIGGAVVDRHSPKQVMMISKYVNTVLLAVLAGLLLGNWLQLWMVYGFALALGVSTAFSIPAGSSMLPRVIAVPQLPVANGVMLSIRQMSMFLGPVLAGLLIAVFGQSGDAAHSAVVRDSRGLTIAFLFDCFSYAISAWTLNQVTLRELPAHASHTANSVLHNVAEGLRFCWQQQELRSCFMYWAAIAFFIMGPMQIAMPVLATQLNNSAATLGLLAGANGAGALLGMLISSIRPGMRFGTLGSTFLVMDFIVALLFMPLGAVHSSWQAVVLLLLIASFGGYLQVAVYTWIQTQVPPRMLGRTMSMFMFIFLGIAPLSSAITGWVMRQIPLASLFLTCSVLLITIIVLAATLSPIRQVNERSHF